MKENKTNKKFEEPKIEIITFEPVDIITTSNNQENDGGNDLPEMRL